MSSLLKMAEFKVGALVLVVAALVGIMSMRVSEDPTLGGAHSAYFVTPNASGLVKNSAVKMAGIPVGVIRDIKLHDGQARIEIVVRDEVTLRKSARAEIKSNGILGDKYVEITPGQPDDPPLDEGGQIFAVSETGSMDNVLGSVGEIATEFKEVAKSLREAVGVDGTNKHILGRIVQNIEKLTGDIAQVTTENKDQIREIVDQVNSITKSLDDVLNDKDKGIKKSWAKLDRALANIEEITEKVNKGDGTIGRLINDDSTVEGINNAIEGVSGFFDSAGKLQTSLEFQSDFLAQQEMWKSYIGIKFQPGLDRYYLLQIVDDPVGVVEKTNTITEPVGGTRSEIDETKTYKNKVKMSILFAKNFYDFTVKGGLIENSGGLGFDYNFFRRKLRLSLEAFELSNMNLRASLRYNIWKGIYLSGGVSDALNKSDRYSNFIGAGLFLTNDDVKILMTKVPL